MNAALGGLAGLRPPPSATLPPFAELLAGWEVGPGALLLLGVADGVPAAHGLARCGAGRRGGDAGPFRAAAWPTRWRRGSHAAMHGFAAACRLPPALIAAAPGQLLTLTPAAPGDAPPVVATLPPALIGPADFAAVAGRLAAGAPAPLARFLLDILGAPATAARADVAAMLIALFDATAEPDGAIELVAQSPEHGLFLHGWGRSGGGEVVLIGAGGIRRHSAAAAGFARGDVAAPAGGAILVLPPAAAGGFTVAPPAQVVLLDGDRLRCRRLLPAVRVLDAGETAALLRPLLPSLDGDAAALAALSDATRPAFAGLDTLNIGDRPLRMAVDVLAVAAGAPEQGAYLHGWLLDPERQVRAVVLRATGAAPSAGIAIEARWTRIPRPDVSDAFAATITPDARQQEHGFAVHAPGFRLPPGGAAYLQLDLLDGSASFMPLPQPLAPAGLRARLLRTADLHKPSGIAVVERQLAPFFLALGHAQVEPSSATPVLPPLAAADWAVAIVIPLADPVCPRALLSQFLADPLAPNEGLVVVCGPAWHEAALARLAAEMRFRSLPALLLRTDAPVSPAAALDAASAASRADWLLVAEPQTHGRTPGWRGALRAAAAAHAEAACLCPTLLYEDFSVRCTGVRAVQALPHAPWFATRQPDAGLPAALLRGQAVQPVLAGSLACCLIARRALTAVGGAARASAGAAAEALDLFFRFRRAGLVCLWVPDAVLYAPDAAEPAGDALARVGRLVDGWCLARQWLADLASSDALEESACAS